MTGRCNDAIDDPRRAQAVFEGGQAFEALAVNGTIGVGDERFEAVAVALGMPRWQRRQPALFGTAGTRAAHEDFLALLGPADPQPLGILLVERHARIGAIDLEPEPVVASGRDRLTVNDASVPAPVLNIAAATSSLSTACLAPPVAGVLKLWPVVALRSAMTVANAALASVKRSPLTHSTRSHQCEPMSANTRDAPPSAGSTRQLLLAGSSSQSCR